MTPKQPRRTDEKRATDEQTRAHHHEAGITVGCRLGYHSNCWRPDCRCKCHINRITRFIQRIRGTK